MRRKLGELLIEAGAVSREDVDAALSDQSAGEPSRLGDLLLSTGKCTPNALARALAAQHEMPFADLSYVAPEASGLIPIEFQRAHRIVPFRLDREGGATRIHIAIADPTITDVVDELRSQLKREIVVHVAPIDDIENVHLALSGEGAEEPVVMGEVLEDEVYAPPAEAAVVGEATFDFPAAPLPVETADPGLGAFDFPPAPEPVAAADPGLGAFDFPPAPEPVAAADPGPDPFDFPAAPAPAAAPGPFEFPAPPEPAITGADLAPFDFPPAPEPDITVENPLPALAFAPAPPVAQASVDVEEFLFAEPAPPAAVEATVDVDAFSFDEPAAPVAVEAAAAVAVDVDEFNFPEPSAPDPSAFGAPSADLGAEAPAAPAAPSVTEADLFGELDLPAATADAPLSTALADEIGRHDQAPPMQESVGFSALSPPLGDSDDRFGSRASSPIPAPPPSDPVPLKAERPLTAPEPPPSVPMPEPAPLLDAEVLAPIAPEPPLDVPSIVPAPLVSPMPDVGPVAHESTQKFAGNPPADVPKIPSFAIPPDVPVEPRRSPIEPLRRPAALGRIALKRVAVNRAGEAVEVPPAPAPPPPPAPVAAAPVPEPVAAEAAAPDLALPDWMRSSSDAAPPVLAAVPSGQLGPALVALLAQVESGALPSGPVLAAVLRLLVEHRVVDDADVSAVLEKLK